MVGSFADRNLASVDEEHGRFVDVEVLAKLDRSVYSAFGGLSVGAGADLSGVQSGLGGGIAKRCVRTLWREGLLSLEDVAGEFEESRIAGLLRHAHAVSRCLVGLRMDGGQREIFKDEVGLRKI